MACSWAEQKYTHRRSEWALGSYRGQLESHLTRCSLATEVYFSRQGELEDPFQKFTQEIQSAPKEIIAQQMTTVDHPHPLHRGGWHSVPQALRDPLCRQAHSIPRHHQDRR